MEKTVHVIFFGKIFSDSHIMSEVKINPKIYPPVGPNNVARPDLKDENTGSPIMPRSIHIIMDRVALFPPINKQVTNTPKVCKVIGTAIGIDIIEHTDNNIANKDI